MRKIENIYLVVMMKKKKQAWLAAIKNLLESERKKAKRLSLVLPIPRLGS